MKNTICYQYKVTLYEESKKHKVRNDTIYPDNPFGLHGQFKQDKYQFHSNPPKIVLVIYEPICAWRLKTIHYRFGNPAPQNVVIPESLN